ncbi:MAG: MgtC/SapB transporter [Herbinix sp.]|jgi:putative Mg2+ transporter-C (MgtC) family protein|nr:MgtC/SapB transporter [Herbinix sp.]
MIMNPLLGECNLWKGGNVLLEEILSLNIVTTIIRLVLALLCGGILGFERGRKKRPAGFRTYMLVCVGAALVMMTNEYICDKYNTGDPARMAAQVISGIGFLGAGTIIVTGHNRVKGLTTAAGLWAAACIGLAIGIGYYSGALIGCLLIFVAMAALHNVDERVMAATKVLNIYVEFERISNIGKFIEYIKERDMKVSDFEITRSNSVDDVGIAAFISLRLPKKQPHTTIMTILNAAEGVKFIEEV